MSLFDKENQRKIEDENLQNRIYTQLAREGKFEQLPDTCEFSEPVELEVCDGGTKSQIAKVIGKFKGRFVEKEDISRNGYTFWNFVQLPNTKIDFSQFKSGDVLEITNKDNEKSSKATPQVSSVVSEDVRSKVEELKAKLARARSIKSKAKIQAELDALEITEAEEEVVQPVKTATRDLADSLFPEIDNLNDNQITKSKMRILWNSNKEAIVKKWEVESFDKFYNLAKLDPKITEWVIKNCK